MPPMIKVWKLALDSMNGVDTYAVFYTDPGVAAMAAIALKVDGMRYIPTEVSVEDLKDGRVLYQDPLLKDRDVAYALCKTTSAELLVMLARKDMNEATRKALNLPEYCGTLPAPWAVEDLYADVVSRNAGEDE
jgi:hypothetical protein